MELGESVKESGGNSTVDSTGGSVSEASVDSVVNVIDMTLTEGSPLLAGGEWNNFLQLPHCTPSSVEYLNNDFLNELEARKSKQELKIFRNAWLVEFQNTSQHESNEAQTDHEEVHKVMVISLALAGKYSLLFPSKKSKGSLPLTDLEENMSLQSLSAQSSVDDLCSDLLDEKLTGKSKEGPLKTAIFGTIVTLSNANGSEDEIIQIKDEKKDKQLMESLLAACQGRGTEKKKYTTSHNECIQYMSYDCQLTSEGKVRSRQTSPPPPGGLSNPGVNPSTHSLSAAGDCLPFNETSLNNLSEYYDVTIEEEEDGSVPMSFVNNLSHPQPRAPESSAANTDNCSLNPFTETASSDEVATVQKLVQDLRHLGTTILLPSPTGDVQDTPSSTKDVQPTTSSSSSTGIEVCLAQEETAFHENGNESNAKMIVGHFSSLPKDAVGPTGGADDVQAVGKPFYIDQSVLVYSSVVAVPSVPAHEDSEGSHNGIAAISGQKMDQKETARSGSTLEGDEYFAQHCEEMKDTMEPPPPEGKIIFSTCAEFLKGSMLPLPSAAAMADTIGKGGNGVVSYVYHNGKEFAVKETCLREEEMRTLSKLSGQASRNVLPISAVMEGPPLDRYHGRRSCYQLMPRATGDVRQMLGRSGSPTLCDYLYKYKREPAKYSCVLANTRVVLRQALRGLQHLHSKSIVHRDVKLQNILLDMRCGCGDVFLCPHKGRDSYRVYLADFDSALDVERARGRLEERARKGGSVLRFTPYGTQGYRAPETSFFYCSNQVLSPEPLFLATRMVLGSALTPYLNPAQDLWSFGCTVLKLFVGATGPTSQKEVASVLLADCLRRSTQSSSRYQHSVHGRLTVDDEEMKKLLKVSSVKPVFPLAVELQDLIRQCLQVDPHLRPSAKQCANLPFFKPIDPATDKNSYPSEPRQDTPAVELPYRTRATHGDQSSHSEPEGLQGSPESVLSPKSSNGGNTGPPSSTPPVVQMQSRSTSCGRPQDPNEHNSLRGVKSKQLKNDDKQGPGAIGPRSVNSPKSSNGGNTGPPSSTPPVVDPKNRPFAAALLEHPYLNQQGSTLPSAGSGGAEVPPPQSISVQSTQQLSPLTIEHSHAQPQLEASTEDVPMNSCSTSCGRPQDPNEHNSLCGVKVPMNSCSTSCGRPQDPNEHNSLRGVKSNQLKNDDKQGLEAIGLRSVNSPKSSNGGNTGPPSSTPPVPTYLVDKPRHAVSGASGN